MCYHARGQIVSKLYGEGEKCHERNAEHGTRNREGDRIAALNRELG